MAIRIAFVGTSVARGGGAERVLCWLANNWARKGHSVWVITFRSLAEECYPLDASISRIALEQSPPGNGFSRNREWIRSLRRAAEQVRPDVVVSFGDQVNVLVLLALRGLHIPAIVSERSNPTRHRIGTSFQILRLCSYHAADTIVVQTELVRRWFARRALGRRVAVIPNAAVWSESPQGARHGRRRVVAIGRLNREKGHDLLIEAFARVGASFPDWELMLYGFGPERTALDQQIERCGLRGRAHLVGLAEDVGTVLAEADIFVLPSRYEGFPNALLEAMAHGLAVVSFDCPNGPAMIVRHGVDGLLVPPLDVGALAEAIGTLMTDDEKRRALGARAVGVRERFPEQGVLERWEEVIEKAVRGRRARGI
jgi:GalNAc-alpha-(1->4)-GalNAc-alpha-(1->3)-diNAcBac-PP-undecaprenol alpha-1,4-N-acetyl-D-galactosaminyltransferase